MKWIEYRIVRDTYCGFECQIKFILIPIWWQMFSRGGVGTNTFATKEKALNFIKNKKTMGTVVMNNDEIERSIKDTR